MDPTDYELRRENERLKRENERLSRRVATLQTQVQRLTKLLEVSQRQAKRQAAPFRMSDGPKRKPGKPGRKKGKRYGAHCHRQVPPRIDEQYDVPLPGVCPLCGGRDLTETGVDTQYQTEIPRRAIYRQFDIHIGCCEECGHRVQGRHDLQTSDALGAAASQLGSDAHAAFVTLNKDLGLSHGKVSRVFKTLFGIPIARATSARSILRSATLAAEPYAQLRREIRGSPWVVPDETGWRVGGKNAWLHWFVSESATCYEIGDRSGRIPETAGAGLVGHADSRRLECVR